MARRVRVEAPNNLEWVVSRPLLPDWMRPAGLGDVARQYGGGVPVPDSVMGSRARLALPALIFGLLVTLVTLPLLPVVIVLRRRGLAAWTLKAVARPWGRRGPPMILAYHLRGSADVVERAQAELVEKLKRGEGAPDVTGAERIR
jgi:hypothetical protein